MSNFSFCKKVFKTRLLLKREKAPVCENCYISLHAFVMELYELPFSIGFVCNCGNRKWIEKITIRRHWGQTVGLCVAWFKCNYSLNPLPQIQHICGRWLWKHTRNKLETPFKWKYNYWIELKTWRQNEKLLVLSNFFFCRYVFKKPSAVDASESVYMTERFNIWRFQNTSIEHLYREWYLTRIR